MGKFFRACFEFIFYNILLSCCVSRTRVQASSVERLLGKREYFTNTTSISKQAFTIDALLPCSFFLYRMRQPIRLSQHLPAPPPDLDTLTRTTTADSPTSSSRPNTSPLSNASSTGNPPTAPPTPRKVPEQTNGFSRAQHQISTMVGVAK